MRYLAITSLLLLAACADGSKKTLGNSSAFDQHGGTGISLTASVRNSLYTVSASLLSFPLYSEESQAFTPSSELYEKLNSFTTDDPASIFVQGDNWAQKTWENSRLWIGTTGEISTVQFVQKNPFLFVRIYRDQMQGHILMMKEDRKKIAFAFSLGCTRSIYQDIFISARVNQDLQLQPGSPCIAHERYRAQEIPSLIPYLSDASTEELTNLAPPYSLEDIYEYH